MNSLTTHLRKVLLSACIFLFVSISVTAGTEGEIQYLLQYIGNTDCSFIRNNNTYSGMKAKAHIEKKYAYAQAWIQSTEDFIRLTATKSSISGKSYLVRCQGVEYRSAQWLSSKLQRFRNLNK
ncbi:MAG: DUF5329 domain-containing protein [Gammaproteobacteria bacterium]|nr:DUF5329 domain-containing protein [Gammaproteobacteria bacterium]